MYTTDLVYPSEESYIANRLVDESRSISPITEQQITHIQRRLITVLCANFDDVDKIITTLQEDDEWHHNINNGTAPQQEGLNQFQGTITCQRFLRLQDPHDSGYYEVGVEW